MTPTRHAAADENVDPNAEERQPISSLTIALFVLGCAMLVAASLSLTHLTEWTQRWGEVPVFLALFLVLSLAGRWFWAGVDAFIAAIRHQS